MRIINVLKSVGLVLCCSLAISASAATNYVSEAKGGANLSSTGGIDIGYLTSNYEIHQGYDIGQGIVSLLLPDGVDDVVGGMGGKVVSYVKGKLIDGASVAYNVDVTSLVDALTPKYDKNTVVAKSKGDVSSHGMLSVIRKFSFQNALMYFNVVMLTVAGVIISSTFFKSLWAMMSLSDNNASYKRMIMLIPSVAISLFALLPTSNGLSGGQMVLLTAFLVSNYVGSVLVTIPSFFFPIIAVDSVFTHVSNGLHGDPIFEKMISSSKADVNIAAKNMFFAESAVEAMLDDGLLDATIKGQMLKDASDATYDDYNGGMSDQNSVFVGGSNVSYTNAYIQHKTDEANGLLGSLGVLTVFKRSASCFTSPNWDLLYSSKECQPWFLLTRMRGVLYGSNAKKYGSGLEKAFYDTVKARVIEMKKVVCSTMDASQRASSYVCQIKDANGFTGAQYGSTKPNIKSVMDYASFESSPLYSALRATYDADLAKIQKGHNRNLTGDANKKAQIYVRGIMSTPFQILTQMMGDDGKNLSVNARETVTTNILNQLSALKQGMASINLLKFVDFADVGLGAGRLYSKFACAQNADYCDAPTSEQKISNQLIAFTKFNDIFYSLISGYMGAKAESDNKADGAGGVYDAIFPADDRNTNCLLHDGRGCMPTGQTPLSTPRADGMNWMRSGVYGWITGEVVESIGRLIQPASFIPKKITDKIIGAGDVIKFVSSIALAIGTGLCYLGIFIYIALTMKMYFRCVIRLLVSMLAQPVVAVAFMLNGFNEIRTDTENMTTSRFFAQSVVRMLVDCVCLSVAVLVSLTLVLFAQGIMSIVSRIYIWQTIGDNVTGANWFINIAFQLAFPFIMCWCIWKCAKLVPYLFEKVGDFVEDKTGVQMQDNHDLVADFKRIMNPKGMYGG